MAISLVGAGSAAQGNNASPTPALPSGYGAGDFLLCAGVFRTTAGTMATPAGWTQIFNAQTSGGIPLRLAAWYKIAASGAETNPLVAVSGGVSGNTVIADTYAIRGVDNANPISVTGTLTGNSDAQNIGPIAGISPAANDLVIVIGARADDWTSVATITGDGLTWGNLFQAASTLGSDAGLCAFAALDAAATAITAKTIVVTGGTPNFPGTGIIFSLKADSVTRVQPQVISLRTVIGTSSPSAAAVAPTVWTRSGNRMPLGANWASSAPDDWGSDAVALLGSGLWTRTTYFPSDTGVWAFTKDPSFALANGQLVEMTVTNVVGNISLNEHNSAYPSDPASYLTNLAAGIATAQPSLVNIENETTLTKYWTDSSGNLTALIDLAHTVTFPLGIPLATDGLISGSVVNVVVRLMRDGYTAANGTVVAGDGGTSTTGTPSGDFWNAAKSTGQQYNHTQAGDSQSDRGMEWLNAAIASKAEYLNVHCYWNDSAAVATMIRVLQQYSGKPVCCNESTTISTDPLHDPSDTEFFQKMDEIVNAQCLCWIASGTFDETQNEPMFNHYDGSPPSLSTGGTSWKSYIDSRLVGTTGDFLRTGTVIGTPAIKIAATPTPAAIQTTTVIGLSQPSTQVQPAGGYIAMTTRMDQPTVTGAAKATPAVISTTTVMGAPTMGAGISLATPDAVATTTVMDTPTIKVGAVVTPATIMTTTSMPGIAHISSPFGYNGTSTISSAHTVTSADDGFLFLVNASAGGFSQALPDVTTLAAGFRLTFKKMDTGSGIVTIDPSGEQKVDGVTTITLKKLYDSVSLQTDGVAWYVTGRVGEVLT